MAWDLANVMDAVADALAPVGVTVHARPPGTFNVPALLVMFPTGVEFSTPTISIDLVEMAVLAAVSLEAPDQLSALVTDVRQALGKDTRLGGAVQTVRVARAQAVRPMAVAGATYLTCQIVMEVHT
jgi:hypothetical protein